jgi:hypothetical protein
MYCPQCGNESQSTVQYCRICGANLKVIGKAVALSEAIARSDRGPLPKLKEMVKGLNVDLVTDEVSRAFDRVNQELSEVSSKREERHERRRRRRHSGALINIRKKKTAEERREQKITKGIVSLFSGAGLTVFLYYLSAAIVLRLPPEVVARIPFEIESVVRVLWWFGFIPMLSGVGNIIAGLCIRPRPDRELEPPITPPRDLTEGESTSTSPTAPASVTERTTNLLEHNY